MKATKVSIAEARATLAKLVERALLGEEIIFTRDSKAVARLVPIADPKGSRQPGALEGKIVIKDEFFEPMSEAELAEWEGDIFPPNEPKPNG